MSSAPLCELDLTVRVGCRLVYENPVTVPLLLNFRPRSGPRQKLQAEKLALGDHHPAEFEDPHGNTLYRFVLPPGRHEFVHDAFFLVPSFPDNHEFGEGEPPDLFELPPQFLRYTLPSRYCDSDKLLEFAWDKFGRLERGLTQVKAICDWLHHNIEYRFGSGRSDISAHEVITRGYGVCRDFAHMGVAVCRALNLPARYVTGHLPDIGFEDPGTPMDFHAYFEVYLSGKWHTYDPRFNIARIGRIKVSCGLDAVESAFSTVYGTASLTFFEVWAYQVPPNTVSLGDPVELSLRLDGTPEIRRHLVGGCASI